VESRYPHHGADQLFIKCSQCRKCNFGFASQIKTFVGTLRKNKGSCNDFIVRQTSQAHLRTFEMPCAMPTFAL
jgi:hypothetical protein